MVRLVQSRSARDRLSVAAEFISRFAPGTEILLVAPSRPAADDLAREIAHSRPASFGLHRFSLMELASRIALAQLAESDRTPASRLSAEAVAARAVFESRSEGELNYFAPVRELPGFVRAVAHTLTESRQAGLTPEQLEPIGASGMDNAALVRNYQQQLARASLADRADLFRVAKEAVKSRATRFCGMPLAFVDVALRWRREREFVEALLAQAPEALVTVVEGDRGTGNFVKGLSDAEFLPQPAPESSSLGRLRQYLFSKAIPSRQEPDESVLFFSAPGEERESVEIARLILEQAGAGFRFDQIAVLVRDPRTYVGFLETAFHRATIPAYFAPGTTRPDPSGRAFLALLACTGEALSAKRFAEYLSFAQVPRLSEAGAPPRDRHFEVFAEDEALGPAGSYAARSFTLPPADPAAAGDDSDQRPQIEGTLRAPWRWEELLVEAAVIGGSERWTRRLHGLEKEFALQLEALRKAENGSARMFRVERDLHDLEHLRRFALPVIDALTDLPKSADWREWLAQLERLAPMVLANPERVLSVLADLRPMGPIGPVGLKEVTRVLEKRLSDLEREPPAYRYGRVLVATPEQVRGRSFEVVFVPGLAERLFPQKLREDPLLLDELRGKLGEALPTNEDRLDEERLLLALATGAARKRLFLSYPRLETSEGRPRVPSFYALEVQRATSGEIPSFEQLSAQAERVVKSRLAWPAPRDARLAVDDAEHDLAMLEPWLRGKADEVRGRAAYLLELNPHLARSLRSRWARWTRDWRDQDGFSTRVESALGALQGHRLRERPYSVSALQKFAVCPYRFFLAAILRLEPRRERIRLEQLDPLTRGHLFHRVQAELLRALAQAEALPLALADLDRANHLLDQVLDQVAARYREDLAPAIERVWQDELEGLRADLRGWLRAVAEKGGNWKPIHFEFGFGLPGGEALDPASTTDPVSLPGGYLLHGIVDLIEERVGDPVLRVTDHKTGREWTSDGLVVGGGESLQPALYGMAVEIALGRQVVEGRLFYATAAGRYSERVVALGPLARAHADTVLRTIDSHIAAPFLVPAPKAGACSRCDFREVCGPYEELRAARKPQDQLAELNSLRALP